MKRRILIVEDDSINRKILSRILEEDYDVQQAEDGMAALEILKESGKFISAVILDIMMPRMNGFEVLEQMRLDSELSLIPVIVATGSDEMESERKALKAGAIDYITKPYEPDILKNRLHNTITLREQSAIANASRKDALTGLLSRAAFFDCVREAVLAHQPGYYILASFDIERFRVINDQYGTKKGDEVLRQIAFIFEEGFTKCGGLVSRIMADQFAVLYPSDFADSDEIDSIRRRVSVLDGSILPPSFCVGRYLVDDITLEPGAMYDRAVMARESVKGRYDTHIAVYDDKMRNGLIEEQTIISEMKQALESNQFEVWYQPQYNHVTKSIIGAEALVRWRHPDKGIVSPGLFVPIFEKNGFIYEVDRYVWKQVCVLLRKRMDADLRITPVSVNISRYDIFRDDLVEYLCGLIQEYGIPVDYLRLEITESAFSKSSRQIIQVINELHNHGFTIEIDDFGSGYSSLNTLKDVPADVLKLDMKFLEGKDHSDKGGNILESIVRMARWIGMSVIAEGVEEESQADFLKSVGCYYIQGYFYSKPLPETAYITLLDMEKSVEQMETIEKVETYDIETFWNPDSMETLIFNSFVGGACIFEYQEERVEILRVNDKYNSLIFGEDFLSECNNSTNFGGGQSEDKAACGIETQNRTDIISMNWADYVTGEAYLQSLEKMKFAIQSGKEVTDEMELKGVRESGKSVFLKATMRVIARTSDRYLFYCVLDDMTAQREAERQEQLVSEQLRLVLRDMNCGVLVFRYDENGFGRLVLANERFYSQRGYTKEQYEAEVKHVLDCMPDEDAELLYEKNRESLSAGQAYVTEYRVIKRDGSIMFVRAKMSVTRMEGYDGLMQISITDDITEERQEEERQRELLENIPCGAGIFDISEETMKTIYLNRRFWQLVGRNTGEGKPLLPIDSILPEDREAFLAIISKIAETGEEQECEIHILHGSGSYVPFLVRGNVMVHKSGRKTLYVTFVSTSEENVTFRRMLPIALSTMLASSTDMSFVKDASSNYVCVSRVFAQMVGYENEADIIGKNDFDLFEPDIAVKYRTDDKKLLESGESLVDYIENLPMKDGQPRLSLTSKYLLRDSNNQIIGIYGVGRDVTEEKDAYKRLQLLTDSISGGLVTYEVAADDIRVLYLSDGVYHLIGCSKEEYQKRYHSPLEFIAKPDKDRVLGQIRRLVEKGTLMDCTYRVNTAGGRECWINQRGTKAEQSGPRTVVHTVMFDVTEQMVSNRRLRAVEQDNRTRYQNELMLRNGLIRDSILNYQMNLAAGIIEEYHNISSEESSMVPVGVPAEEFLNHSVVPKIHPSDVEHVRSIMFYAALRSAYERGERTATVVYRRLLQDGQYHWVRMNAFMMQKSDNGDAVAFLYCKEIDHEWKKQLSIATVLNEDIESVIYVDVKTGIGVLAHMLERCNYNKIYSDFVFEEEYRKYCSNVVVKEDRDAFLEFYRLEHLVAALKESELISFIYRVEDSDKLLRKAIKVYYLDESRDIIVIIRRDITNLYEEEQRQKQVLELAVRDAKEANHAKSEFLSRMSHDIRTPLNAILAFSNEELWGDAEEDKVHDYLRKINRSGEYLLGIINDVLDMSRIEQKKIKLHLEPYPLYEFIDSIHNVIDEQSKRRSIEFIMDVSDAGAKTIVADRIRINQIFINLLTNAVKFTGRGGKVEFVLGEKPSCENNTVIKHFMVRDNGIGMSEEFLPRAFESFNQEYRKDTSERSQGTGLGLSIVKELVSMMGGTIAVESHIGVGTTFELDIPFPVADMAEMRQTEELPPDYSRLKGVRILLAEDNDINAEIARVLLEKKGCLVERAENGEIACTMFRNSQENYYRIILMDIRMPVMNGLDATAEIRKSGRTDAGTVQIIAMTADAFEDDERKSYLAGMDAYISKPIDPKRLYDLCLSVLI